MTAINPTPKTPPGDPYDQAPWRYDNELGDDSSGANHAVIADLGTHQDHCAGPDMDMITNRRWSTLDIGGAVRNDPSDGRMTVDLGPSGDVAASTDG